MSTANASAKQSAQDIIAEALSHRIVAKSVSVCRSTEGELNAFRNACAHRGAEIANGVGKTKTFRCPNHAKEAR